VIHSSAARGDLARAAKGLAGEDALILATGGDGTSHEVINGLVGGTAAVPTAAMGWLPLGSGNDLARSLGVPLDGPAALDRYQRWTGATIDVGRVRYRGAAGAPVERIFGNSLTFGLSAEVLRLVERTGKPLGGRLSYFLATLETLATTPATALALDGVEGLFRLVSITNGTSIGAGMRITPAARLDDGQLDLVTVGDLTRPAAALLFPRIYWGGHLTHPGVRARPITRLTVSAAGPLAFEADGELFLGSPPFDITVEPSRLRVARPASAPTTR
jgi:diacylglycerol kinase (ATP)